MSRQKRAHFGTATILPPLGSAGVPPARCVATDSSNPPPRRRRSPGSQSGSVRTNHGFLKTRRHSSIVRIAVRRPSIGPDQISCRLQPNCSAWRPCSSNPAPGPAAIGIWRARGTRSKARDLLLFRSAAGIGRKRRSSWSASACGIHSGLWILCAQCIYARALDDTIGAAGMRR